MLGILEVVIPENRKNSYWFQKFAETKFLNARDRDSLRVENRSELHGKDIDMERVENLLGQYL